VTGEAIDAILPYDDEADLLVGDRGDRLRAREPRTPDGHGDRVSATGGYSRTWIS
jgi:hypothetical protein